MVWFEHSLENNLNGLDKLRLLHYQPTKKQVNGISKDSSQISYSNSIKEYKDKFDLLVRNQDANYY